MKFAYTILYVPDVEKASAFYERASGLKRKFIDEKAQYAELETGATTLSFAAEELATATSTSRSPRTIRPPRRPGSKSRLRSTTLRLRSQPL